MDHRTLLKETWKQMAGAFLGIYPTESWGTFVISLPYISSACLSRQPPITSQTPPPSLRHYATRKTRRHLQFRATTAVITIHDTQCKSHAYKSHTRTKIRNN